MNSETSENSQSTPVSCSISKKRELTSPEFDIEIKKNKLLSASSESDLDSSMMADISVTTNQGTAEVTMATSTPSAVQEGTVTPHITIPPSEMIKISDMLKETFRGEIESLVDSIVKGVLKGLQDRVDSLEKTNAELRTENGTLSTKVETLEKQIEQAEQYSRRNCLRVSGLQEETNEDTDALIMRLASTVGSEIQISDIDRSHRVGNPRQQRDRPRDIIVKFSTYRSRQKFYKHRTALKDTGYRGVFVNEDLTRQRSTLLYEARKLFKSSLIKGAWSSDGTVLVKDLSDRVHRVNSLSDLSAFRALRAPVTLST